MARMSSAVSHSRQSGTQLFVPGFSFEARNYPIAFEMSASPNPTFCLVWSIRSMISSGEWKLTRLRKSLQYNTIQYFILTRDT